MRDENRRTIFIALLVGFIVAIVIIIGFYIASLNNDNKERISIKNYSEYVKNLPSSEREALETMLYRTVSNNLDDDEKIKSINDAYIRNDSYSQDYKDDAYTTTFIVDIESIKQSYKLQSVYANYNNETVNLDYTQLVLCLEKDKLKYGDFNCKDRISDENGLSRSDPILEYLPLSTLDYTVSIDTSSKDLKLIAKLILTEVDYKLGVDDAVAEYKEKLRTWFESKDLNIDDYSITYEY